MTLLATTLQDRSDISRESDVARERDFAGRPARLRSRGDRRKETDKGGEEPPEPVRRCLRPEETSDTHRIPPWDLRLFEDVFSQ
jgi:hypothetical protein